jgi:hypothetical protein
MWENKIETEVKDDPLLGMSESIPQANLSKDGLVDAPEETDIKQLNKSQVYIDKDGIMHYGSGE